MLFFPACSLWAQPRHVPAAFVSRELHLHSDKEVVSNTLVLFNQTPGEQVFTPFDRPEGLRVFNLPDSIVVPPFSSVSVPVKFLPLRRSLQPAEGEWYVRFSGSRGDTIKASFRITADTRRLVVLQSEADPLPATGTGNTFSLSFRIVNKGNTTESVVLQLAPGRFRLLPRQYHYTLSPFSDTVVRVQVEEDRYARQYDATLPLFFTLSDNSGLLLSSLTLASPGIAGNGGPSWQRDDADNYLLLQTGGIGTNYRFHEAILSYNPYARDGGLSLFADVVQQAADGRKIIRNSYLGYRAGAVSARVGTINRYDLLPLTGQGAELQLGSNENSRAGLLYLHTPNTYFYNDGLVDAGALRSLSGFFRTPLSASLSGGVKMLQQWEHGTDARNTIGALDLELGRRESGNVAVEGAFSQTRSRDGVLHRGWLGSLKARYRYRRWQLEAGNVSADPFFSGLLQNSSQLQNSLSYTLHNEAHTFSVYQSDLRNGRRYDYLSNQVSDYRYSNTQYGLSWQWRPSAIQVQLTPYYTRQAYRGVGDYRFSSFRTALALQAACRSWRADIRADAAWWQQDNAGRSSQPLRVQGTLLYRFLSLQVLYQHGSYYITDLPGMAATGKEMELLNLGPSIRLSGWHRRLELTGGYNLQFDKRFDYPLHYVQAAGLLRLTPFADFRTEWYYYRNSTYRNSDLRFSLQLFFGRPADWRKNRRKLMLFEDENLNGSWDAGERRLGNTSLQYSDHTLRSDRKGFIRWKGESLPSGLTVAGNTGYALVQDSAVERKGTVTALPLYRMGRLAALVKVQSPKYLNAAVDPTGIVVQLVAGSGKMYTATVRSGGKLELYAPAGDYTLRLAPESAEVFALKKSVTLSIAADESRKLELELIYRLAREVEVKKFGNSVQK